MRARFPAVLITVVLIASACTAATPSVVPGSASAPASVAPSSAAPPTEDVPTTLRVARISDFLPSIHPVDLGTGNQELMADIVFSTLVDVDSDEVTILPDLATEWTASPDAPVYTFKLNPAAVWSDGQPVTADDVEYTLAWSAQNPTAFKQIPVDMWVNIKGGDDVAGTKNIPEGIKKIDANTVELTLKAPDATFLRRIAGAVYYILPKHKLENLTAEEALTCPFCLGTVGETIGSGPYDFSESISAVSDAAATAAAEIAYFFSQLEICPRQAPTRSAPRSGTRERWSTLAAVSALGVVVLSIVGVVFMARSGDPSWLLLAAPFMLALLVGQLRLDELRARGDGAAGAPPRGRPRHPRTG